LKSTKNGLSDLTKAAHRLHEELEGNKALTNELKGSFRKVTAHVKQVHEGLDKNSADLMAAQGKLEEQGDTLQGVRQGLDKTAMRVQGLRDGHEMATHTLTNLQEEVLEVGNTAHAVKAGLKETSALLLPNIHMDSLDAKRAVARHGSMLAAHSMPCSPKKNSLLSARGDRTVRPYDPGTTWS